MAIKVKIDFGAPLTQRGKPRLHPRTEDGELYTAEHARAGLKPSKEELPLTLGDICLTSLDGPVGIDDSGRPLQPTASQIGDRYAIARLIEATGPIVELKTKDIDLIKKVVENPVHGWMVAVVGQAHVLLDTVYVPPPAATAPEGA